MSEQAPSLDLILRKLDQVIQDNGIFRDDMRVQTAILMRVDNTLAALLVEVRAGCTRGTIGWRSGWSGSRRRGDA